MARTRFVRLLGLATAGLVGAALLAGPGQAVQVNQPVIVSANPANFTPNVMNGSVKAIAQVGNQIFIGGDFTQVQAAGSATTLTRNYLLAFNATTGAISTTFVPQLNNSVEALIPAPDGQSVYVAGRFSQVNGVNQSRVARLAVSNGARVAGFGSAGINAAVRDMRLHPNGNLIIGGPFTSVGGQTRTTLASLSASTGAVTSFVNHNVTTTRTGSRNALKMDLSPDGSRLIVIGNFTSVDGQSRPQLAVYNTAGATSTLFNWQTNFYAAACAGAFDTYMRDLDIDPTGRYVVVSTTGAYRGSDSPCDTIARFELNRTGTGIPTTWRAYTGGDTSYAVVSTGTAIYVGGHFRWMNNPFDGDAAGPGAVPRQGIAALDPRNGLPYTWNPGRDRGVGVFDLIGTSTGLWVGSDTDRIAGELRRKIAFMPTAGGTAPPPDRTGQLPTQVVRLGTGLTTNTVSSAQFDGTTATGATNLTSTEAWASARGAFQVDGTLYAGWSNGTLTRRTFNGTTFGAPTTVNLYGGSFAADLPSVTGMVYSRLDGRLYYTMSGSNQLFWRYFTPQSSIVGAARFTATGAIASLAPSRVRGMFLSGNQLYFADANDGQLRRITLADGAVSGTATVVNTAVDWRSRGIVIRGNDAGQPNPLIPQ